MKKERSETYLNEYRKLINYHHQQKGLVIFSDGSGDNSAQTEPIKFGFLIYEKGKMLHSDSQICYDKFNTSVKSEIMGLNLALHFLIQEGCTTENITIFSDNKWLVEWCINNRSWYSKSTDKAYYESFVILRSYMNEFNRTIKGFWVPREVNQEADLMTR
jgi:ribonuclease HI